MFPLTHSLKASNFPLIELILILAIMSRLTLLSFNCFIFCKGFSSRLSLDILFIDLTVYTCGGGGGGGRYHHLLRIVKKPPVRLRAYH